MESQAISGSTFALILVLVLVFILIIALSKDKRKTSDQVEKKSKADTHKKATIEAKKSHTKAKVCYVIDGDTVVVSKSWHKIKIRLDSIDCPEDGQHWGDIARFGLIKLIGGRTVFLEEYGQDHHGRTLATIHVRNKNNSDLMNVNARMVTLGHAWVMRKYYDHLPKDRQIERKRNINPTLPS